MIFHFLHVCGGDPENGIDKFLDEIFSPRMWRWSYPHWKYMEQFGIFSTYVEVILTFNDNSESKTNFLHVCGGDPMNHYRNTKFYQFSPRMWRWSPTSHLVRSRILYFLHVCGGDPKIMLVSCFSSRFSPRMWRWSYQELAAKYADNIFSTYVEVILKMELISF